MNQALIQGQFEDANPSRIWLLAQTKPNMTPRAVRNLENQAFRTFVPQIRKTRRVGGQFREKESPLFPGYVFVQADPLVSPWRKINSTFGVSRLVSLSASRPAVVPQDLITELRDYYSPGMDMPPKADLGPDTDVQFIRGPFAGFSARVEVVAANDRVWVLLDVLGRETRMSANKRDIIPI